MNLRPYVLGVAIMAMSSGVPVSRLATGTPAAPHAVAAPATTPPPVAVPGTSLQRLESVWTTDRGTALRLRDLSGSTVVLALVFTHCPRACPTLVHELHDLEDSLRPSELVHTRFVLVTIDPERDTPAVLNDYRSAMGLDPEHWVLLHGSPGDTRELSAVLGFLYGRSGGGGYTHSSLVSVLDRDGVVIHQQSGVASDLDRLRAVIRSGRSL